MEEKNQSCKTLIALVKDLKECDHGFLSVKGVKHFTQPFGFVGKTRLAKVNPNKFKGLSLNEGMTEAVGQDADKTAKEIADNIGLKEGIDYPFQHGRGSKLRTICDAIITRLEQGLTN